MAPARGVIAGGMTIVPCMRTGVRALAGSAAVSMLMSAFAFVGPVRADVVSSGRVCFGVSGEPGDIAVVNLTPVLAERAGFGLLVSSDIDDPPVASNVNFVPGGVD